MMKLKHLTPILCLILASSALAGSDSYFVLAFSGSKGTAVSLEKMADYVSMPLTIESKQREPNARFAEIKQAQDLIISKVQGKPGLVIHKGPISLSPKPISKFPSFSSYSYNPSSQAQFHVLAKLNTKDDIYTCASRIRRFIDSISMPGKSSHSLGQIKLAVGSPEKYRQDLLKKIARDIGFVKSTVKTVGTGTSLSLLFPYLSLYCQHVACVAEE